MEPLTRTHEDMKAADALAIQQAKLAKTQEGQTEVNKVIEASRRAQALFQKLATP